MKYSLFMLYSLAAVFGMAIVGFSPRSLFAEQVISADSPIAPFTKITLDNGLEVIVKEAHAAPIVAVYLWCRTGSINESEREHGISHFYEHMFFKGTEKRGVGEIDRAIKSLGGYNNAFTSKEYTAYYVVLPSENFSLAADVLVDAIRNLSFPADEIAKERGVIKEEINRKEDNPMGKLYEEIFKALFPDAPYAHPVLGTKVSVSNLEKNDFKDYLAKFYVPNNMTAVVVGDIDTDEAVGEFRKLTKDWEPACNLESNRVSFEIKKHTGIKEFTLEKDVNMSYVLMAFQTSGLKNPKENAALDIASSVLGEGRSSRLYKRIVERDQVASSVQAFIYPLTHAGMFVVYGTMDPSNVDSFRKAVLEELAGLMKSPPDNDELAKVKTMLKADFQFGNETNSDIGQTLGHYNTLNILDRALSYEKDIDAMTSSDVRSFASNVLNPESYVIGIVNPRPEQEEVRSE